MATLKTNYKSDVLADSMNNTRKFNIIDGEGNIVASNCTIQDVSTYEQVGDEYTAEDVNAQNREINRQGTEVSRIAEEVATMGQKVLKYGVISGTTTIELDEELDPSKYRVDIHTSGTRQGNYASAFIEGGGSTNWTSWGYGNGAYLSAKTSTSITITLDTGITASYEIIQIAK